MEGEALVRTIPAAVVDCEHYAIARDAFQEIKSTDKVLLYKRNNALTIMDVDSSISLTVSFDGLRVAMEKLAIENS